MKIVNIKVDPPTINPPKSEFLSCHSPHNECNLKKPGTLVQWHSGDTYVMI